MIYKAKTLDELDYIQNKIETTKKINRRTKAGREFTNELLEIINNGARQLINEGAEPF